MNYLNLDKEKTQNTVNELNILLADYHYTIKNLETFTGTLSEKISLIFTKSLK